MIKNKATLKLWIYISLSLVFSLITIFLNNKTYFGLLTLIPGIIAIIFGVWSLKIAYKTNVSKVFPFACFVFSLFASILIFVGELKTKYDDKVDFIENFSKEIDNNLEKSDSGDSTKQLIY